MCQPSHHPKESSPVGTTNRIGIDHPRRIPTDPPDQPVPTAHAARQHDDATWTPHQANPRAGKARSPASPDSQRAVPVPAPGKDQNSSPPAAAHTSKAPQTPKHSSPYPEKSPTYEQSPADSTPHDEIKPEPLPTSPLKSPVQYCSGGLVFGEQKWPDFG